MQMNLNNKSVANITLHGTARNYRAPRELLDRRRLVLNALPKKEVNMSLASKEPRNMSRTELKIRAMQIGRPTHDSNPVHERLSELEEEDRLENKQILQDTKKMTKEIKDMTILIVILSIMAVAIGIYEIIRRVG